MTIKGVVPVLPQKCHHWSVLNFYHEFAEQYPPNIIKTHEEEMNNFQL